MGIAVFLSGGPDALAQAKKGDEKTQPKDAAAIRLVPRYAAGESLRYQLDVRSTIALASSGLIGDPQGATRTELAISAILRLDVLSAAPAPVRLRFTYEKSQATVSGNTRDPALAALEAQYKELAGGSLEFTITGPDGVSDIKGLDSFAADPRAAATMRDLLLQFARPAAGAPESIAPGQSWSSTQPLPGDSPLDGIAVRVETTYARNEPCRRTLPERDVVLKPGESLVVDGGQPAFLSGDCAVLVGRTAITQRESKDPTPQSYRARGLRTAGTFSGSGESLTSVSLERAILVSLVQTSTESLDLTVTSQLTDSRMRQTGRVESRTVLLLIESPEAPPAKP